MSVPTKKISDLFADVKIGGTPSRGNPAYFSGGNLWVSIRDMEGQPLITKTAETISDEGARNSNCKLVNKGSLLFSFKLTVGRIAFAGADLYTNEAIAAFDRYEAELAGIDLEYLSLVLPIAARGDTTKNSMGAALLNKDKILNLKIPVLDIDEQRQIAARLKAQLAEVETARQAVQAQLRDAALLQRRLLESTFNELTCEPSKLGHVITDIQTGKSFQTAEVLARPDELGVLKVSAVSWSQFRDDQAKALKGEYSPAESHRVKQGDLLISRANTRELVGAIVLVDRDFPMRLLSDKTLRLVIDESYADKNYLLYALRTELAREHIELYATGTSDSMRNISQDVIASTPILLPPIEDQRRIVAHLKQQLAEADALRAALEHQLRELDALPQRILALAFDREEPAA